MFGQTNVLVASNEYYYECMGIADSKTISLSEEQLYACRDAITNPLSCENTITYNATISKAYTVQNYHFYVPQNGYYAIYTTGSNDTLIRVYREKQVLWWMDGFIGDYQTSDDGSTVDSNELNACSILYLEKGYY